MSRWVTVLECGSVTPPALDGWLSQVNAPDGDVDLSWAARVLEDKAGAGDIVWNRILPLGYGVPGDDALPPGMRVSERVLVRPLATASRPLAGARFIRTLFLRVRPGVRAGDVSLLESSLVAMPRHIATIRSWSLSRLDRETTTAGWTHLWEQEFADPRGFRPYMAHPYHWTGVERWFDPEIPRRIVDAEAHYLSPVPGAVLRASTMGRPLAPGVDDPHNQTLLE